MSATRVIVTIRFPEERPGKAADGGPSAVSYVPYVVLHEGRLGARKVVEKARREVGWLLEPGKIGEGGVIVDVGLETNSHNVPALEPDAWERLQKRQADLERRMRG